MTISVGRLKAAKNAAIGNPKTKAALAQDPVLLAAYVTPFTPTRPPNRAQPNRRPLRPRPRRRGRPRRRLHRPRCRCRPPRPARRTCTPRPPRRPLRSQRAPHTCRPRPRSPRPRSQHRRRRRPRTLGPRTDALPRSARRLLCGLRCPLRVRGARHLFAVVGDAVPRRDRHRTASGNAAAYTCSARCYYQLDAVLRESGADYSK
ncbi:hypothetical protein HYPSUDRAFT_40990 [Hypholoma sublateritium FD-334 SS-4]|uniref:Uncharacterized protein n=1 Tax=Hypholoma sublateritium (strain FD-334 SS-4) TaxID=945553 RepID=A0A0D2PR54_HYPSF|nr:hypothetical protein HYPSUDRAFT_40990 [Hypholoma sublateritium FD-334 SS-4]